MRTRAQKNEALGLVAFEGVLAHLSRTLPPRLPRYTSYPTAAEFTREFERAELEAHFNEVLSPRAATSLYVHIPFCAELCYFCACNKIISKKSEDKVKYLRLLAREVSLHRARLLDIQQLHLGGGSPSYLAADQLVELMEILSGLGSLHEAEKSIELDCRTVTSEKLRTLIALGFSRFSLGVQDFDANVQRIINRNQSEQSVSDCVVALREARHTSINFDLVYGLPGQTLKTFARTIEKTIEMSPDRIALYGYAAVEWKVKVQKAMARYHSPTSVERVRLFHHACTLLQEAGYRYIGLDHFAKPDDGLSRALESGKLRRNFMGYTTQTGNVLLGLGCSAISDTGRYLLQKCVPLKDYSGQLSLGELPLERVIKRTDEDIIRAYCIEALMCRRQLSLSELRRAFPASSAVEDIFREASSRIRQQVPAELASVSEECISISERGAIFLRFIVSCFDAYLQHKSGNAFSAAV